MRRVVDYKLCEVWLGPGSPVVSALAEGWELYGSPAGSEGGLIVQAVVRWEEQEPADGGTPL